MRELQIHAAALRDFFRVNQLFTLAIFCEMALLLLLFCKAIFTPLYTLSVSPLDFDSDESPGVRLEADSQLVLRENAEAPDGYSLSAGPYLLRSGAYEVTAYYRSDVDGAGSVRNAAATVQFSAESRITAAALSLDDAHADVTGRVYVPFFSGVKKLQVTIQYAGSGTLVLSGMEFRESGLYRAMRLLGFALLFAAADLFAYAFLARSRRCKRDWGTALALTGIILFASAPFFANYLIYVGHDLQFHLTRIAAVADELGNGQFPVRMMTTMCNGYGYANSLYYCDIFLYLPALLYNCMLPMRICYQIYAISANTATCLISFYSFQRMTGSRKLGLLGTALYTLAVYRLVNVHLRSAVGEYTAMVFLPLVILGMYQIYTQDTPRARDWLPLALGMAGVIMSHTLSVEMAAVLLLIFCVLHPDKTLNRTTFIALVKSALLCLLLTAWYVVPFLECMLLQKTSVALRNIDIQGSGLYPVQLFGLFFPGVGDSLRDGIHGEMPLTLGPALTLGIGCILYVLLHRDAWGIEERKSLRACQELFLAALISMIFTLWCFPWTGIQINLPNLSKLVSALQFPWRFLSPATALLIPAVLFALQEWGRRDRQAARAASLALCAAAVVGAGFFFYGYTHNGIEIAAVFESRTDMENIAGSEYLLKTTRMPMLMHIAQVETVFGEPEYSYEKEKGVGYLQVKQATPAVTVVEVPIFAYRNYRAQDSASGEVLSIYEGTQGKIAVILPGGYQGTVEIRYVPPFYWHIAELVSLMSITALLLYGLRERKRRKQDESCPFLSAIR